jgi:hypothetical protein
MSIRTLGSCLLLCCLASAGASAEAIHLEPTSAGLVLDLLPQEDAADGTEEPSAATPRFGRPYATQGSVAWWIEAGGGTNFDHGWVALVGLGVEWYPVDGFALGVRLDGIGVGLEETPTSGGVGASILVRWHVLRREKWSLYLEGGCGLAYFSDSVPRGAAQLNFTPECGIGMSLALSDEVRLLTGVRWYHISNAQTASNNPGIDMLQGYVGITMPF